MGYAFSVLIVQYLGQLFNFDAVQVVRHNESSSRFREEYGRSKLISFTVERGHPPD